jgi:hypothetical protein
VAGVVCEIQVRVKDVLLVCGMRQLVCAMRQLVCAMRQLCHASVGVVPCVSWCHASVGLCHASFSGHARCR